MTRFLIATALLGLTTGAVAQTPTPAPAGMSFDAFAAKARERMMALDTDHDGKISKAEFAARAETMGKMRRGGGDQTDTAPATPAKKRDPSRMFDRLDTNGNGYLEPAEVNALLAKRFARMDANHDGVVTPDERHAMRGPNAAEQ